MELLACLFKLCLVQSQGFGSLAGLSIPIEGSEGKENDGVIHYHGFIRWQSPETNEDFLLFLKLKALTLAWRRNVKLRRISSASAQA